MRLAGRYGAVYHAQRRPLLKTCLRSLASINYLRSFQQYIDPVTLNDSPNPRAHRVAVLGGGITGLTTAFHLQRTIPHAHVTIYEQKSSLGGWLDSEFLDVDGGQVLFEWGARTLRPDMNGAGLATVMLLVQLNIMSKALCMLKTSPAATNRFVYYPDHLVKMPGPSPGGSPIMSALRGLYTILTEPLFKGVLPSMISEPAVAVRASRVADESVGDFVKRRFGSQIADNLVSAVFHGIYAGDLYKLSARTLLPLLWYAETRDPNGNGVIAEFADLAFKGQSLASYKDVRFKNIVVAAKDIPMDNGAINTFLESIGREVSVYTFIRGVAYLGEKLREALTESNRVTLRTGSSVSKLDFNPDKNEVSVSTSDNDQPHLFDYVVSTLSPGHLQQLTAESDKSPLNTPSVQAALTSANRSVNVMVVNLYYSNPNLIPASYAGFGYLIPRSISLEQNPERALGVIFGSETSGARGPGAVIKIPKPTQEQLDEVKSEMDELKKELENDDLPSIHRQSLEQGIDVLQKQHDMASEEMAKPGERELRLGQDTAPGTKLTVMMGGHWWDGWHDSDLPSEDEAVEMAKAVIARQLMVSEEPAIAKARLNRNCIPQYHVGYRNTMSTIHEGLQKTFQGRLKVAGPWWQGGVGVNDCTRKARLTALSIREGWDETTGLEEYGEDEKWVLFDRKLSKTVMDPMQS